MSNPQIVIGCTVNEPASPVDLAGTGFSKAGYGEMCIFFSQLTQNGVLFYFLFLFFFPFNYIPRTLVWVVRGDAKYS